jgi:hypothetical protein
MSQRLAWLGLLAAGFGLGGCSTMGGSALRTGPVQMPAYSGPVAIYSLGKPPENAVDLGVVEVHASQREATLEQLLPQFARKVADIGGNIAVVEGIRARFDFAGHTQVETFYYTCALGATCAGTRAYSTNDEIMTVSMFGHAMTTQLPDIGGPLIPKPQEMVPDAPVSPDLPVSPPPAPETIPGDRSESEILEQRGGTTPDADEFDDHGGDDG